MLHELIPLMTVLFCFFILGLLVWHALSRRRDTEKARHELQLRLLQSAGSVADLSELMRSEELRSLLAARSHVDSSPVKESRRYAIRAVKTGVVLIFIGAGMLALMAFSNRDWVVGAALALTGGLGLLTSALVSIWLGGRLGKES